MYKYPSGIDRPQFAIIAPILESSCKTTSPRTPDLYDVFSGILYVLKSRSQWRINSKGLTKFEYYYFQCWRKRKVNNTKSIFLKKF